MAWFIGQSLVMIGAAFLLGILVGWLIWGRRSRREDAAPEIIEAEVKPDTGPREVQVVQAVQPVPAVALDAVLVEPAVAAVAVMADEPDDSTGDDASDDLERIEGIGPKMAGALGKAGIHTYAQLAATDEDTLRKAIKAQGLRFAPSIVTWRRQAQLLADGDEEGFEELTRKLTAGRE